MNNTELIKKFRPIFVFSKGERHYPINKKNFNLKEKNIKLKETDNLTSPQEPLYYHVLDEDDKEIAVVYILIFPYSMTGFFNLSGKNGDISSCVAVIDKRTKTLREIYYWNKVKESFEMKTSRPTIFVTANDHYFRREMGKELMGLRWEPEKIENFNLEKLKDKKLEGRYFSHFLDSYRV